MPLGHDGPFMTFYAVRYKLPTVFMDAIYQHCQSLPRKKATASRNLTFAFSGRVEKKLLASSSTFCTKISKKEKSWAALFNKLLHRDIRLVKPPGQTAQSVPHQTFSVFSAWSFSKKSYLKSYDTDQGSS